MWGLYIFAFFFILFILGFASKMILDTFWPGFVVGGIIDIFVFRAFVKYLRSQQSS